MSEPVTSLPEGFELFDDRSVTPVEILELRQEPVTDEEAAVWEKCIEQSLYVAVVREVATVRLAGIGMVAGNQRHAEIVDGTVHPDFRNMHIGRVIMEHMVSFVREEKIKYVGLTHDKTKPWLPEKYARHGFVPIDFAMWLKESIPPSQLDPTKDSNLFTY